MSASLVSPVPSANPKPSPGPKLSRYCLIFANGALADGPAVRSAAAQARQAAQALIIAADGGARHAWKLGFTPHLAIGDFDSLSEIELDTLRTVGTEICRLPAHKDETDLEMALTVAVERNAEPIRVIGAVGDRLDQTLGNVYLLALAVLAGRDVRLVSGRQTTWLASPGETRIEGQPGDTLSLLPLKGDVQGITTDGLEYPLHAESLHIGPARGISNVLTGNTARVQFSEGVLLLVHTIGRA